MINTGIKSPEKIKLNQQKITLLKYQGQLIAFAIDLWLIWTSLIVKDFLKNLTERWLNHQKKR